MKKTSFTILIVLLGPICLAQGVLDIVPYPQEVHTGNTILKLLGEIEIGYEDESLLDAANLLAGDLHQLNGITAKVVKGRAPIILGLDRTLENEQYTITVSSREIAVKGGSYEAVVMAVTSLLQMAREKDNQLLFPVCEINDKPDYEYRGFLLDVARQWHSIETVKQVVELCRWYKIKYLQLHLTDDQSFTFPSKAFPALPSKDRHYTLEELGNLVGFAEIRGVTIIPEMDLPGHSTSMRRAMPELFGSPDLRVIDMADERVFEALDVIVKEMIEVFHTSPYFHIGADEASLREFEKSEKALSYVKEKGLDDVYDIYLNFIVRMHNIVKKHGKKTLVWESFRDKGSSRVAIPTDLTVMAWETLYQRPESLIENGYTIINASWKPTYITSGWRWEPEYIYNWNIRRWENHWNRTPSYKNPIQLGEDVPIFGGQMCSWEMSEEEQLAGIQSRVPAISETFWNGSEKRPYADFKERCTAADGKFSRLIFPVKVEKTGFNQHENPGLYYFLEDQFCGEATLVFTPLLPGTRMTYTTDRSVPSLDSPECPEKLKIDKDVKLRFSVFNEKGTRIGYKVAEYEVNALIPSVSGGILEPRDINIRRNTAEFVGQVRLGFESRMDGATIRYTTDGSDPVITSPEYRSPIIVKEAQTVKAACFLADELYGKMYQYEFVLKK